MAAKLQLGSEKMKCIVYGKEVNVAELQQFEVDAMAPSLLAAAEKSFRDPDFCARFEAWKKERQVQSA